jgi:hypothetical protein
LLGRFLGTEEEFDANNYYETIEKDISEIINIQFG